MNRCSAGEPLAKILRSCAAGAFLVALSCSSTPEGTVTLVTGDETDVFSRAPAPVTLIAERIAEGGERTELARQRLPAETINLGEVPETDVGAISVTGLDSGGKPIVRGETLFVQWGVLERSALQVFVQRTGELARLPLGPSAIDATNVAMLVGQYVLETNDTSAVLYDLLRLRTLDSQPPLPRPAKSVATVGTAALLIDEAGATVLNLSNNVSVLLDPPAGGTFIEVAGGARVDAADGTQYIVGGTRMSGGATARVLIVDKNGKATFAGLTIPREGACATWVEGRGLVVVGGDKAGAGAEVLAPGATIATPLPFPSDPVRGCGAAALDNTHVAVVAGETSMNAPVRVFDLACTTACAPTTWPDAIPLVRAQVATIAADATFIVGDDASGATHAYRASATGLREIPLKIPRRGARMVRTPTDGFVVVGGGVGIEQYLD